MTHLYRIVAESYEYCPTAILLHEDAFTDEQLSKMLEAAETVAVVVEWPKIVAQHEAMYAYDVARIHSMQKKYPETDWAAHYTEERAQGASTHYEYLFDTIIDTLCDIRGFKRVDYTATVRRGGWDTVRGAERCPTCKEWRLKGDKFDDATLTLTHHCSS